MRKTRPAAWVVAVVCLAALLAAAPLAAQDDAGRDDPAAQRLMVEGDRLEREGEPAAALNEYGLVVERFPASRQAELALLRMAEIHRRTGDLVEARQSAERLIAAFPTSPNAAAAFVLKADLVASRPARPEDLQEALATLRRVPLLFARDAYPRLAARAEARVLAGQISLRAGEFLDAAAAFVSAIEDEPPSPWTSRARLGLAEVLLAQGEWIAAADELQRVVNTGFEPGNPERDPASEELARRQLTLIHRLLVRPAGGQKRWQTARLFQPAGLPLKKPVGVAASADGRLAIADSGLDLGLVVDFSGQIERRAQGKDLGHPWWTGDQAYLPAGPEVLLLTIGGSQGFVIPRGDKAERVKEVVAGELGTFGQWYLVDRDQKKAQVFRPGGIVLADLIGGDPVDLAQDVRGRIYVLDRKAATVSRFLPDGASEGVVLRGSWRKPEALANDRLGHLYLLDRDEARLHVYGLDGKPLETLGPQLPGGIELRAPMDVAVDGLGRVYIADSKLSAIVVLE